MSAERFTVSHLVQHGSKSARQRAELAESLFEHGREGQEPQSVASRSRVEHDARELHRLDVPEVQDR